MLDWRKIVREKLGRLSLGNGRKEEVVEELAQQLESTYEEAVANGAGEPEAMRRSLAQFSDWEKLRSEVFQSVEGTQLPIWEQNGIFAPRRWAVWIALALTVALAAIPAFRQALAIMPVPGRDLSAWNSSVFSEKALHRLEQSGDKQKYARTLAFVALHDPDGLEAVHAAEKAIALDPQLTWISGQVSHANYLVPGYDPHLWINRLKAWDPDNAYTYLLEAGANVHGEWETRWARFSPVTPALRTALNAEPRWRIPMEKAFAAPRLDFYAARQFALDRQVLLDQGLDRPDMLLIAVSSQQLPDFLFIKMYEDIQLNDVGEQAEKAGRAKDALAVYWTVARFGERLQSEPHSMVRLFSVELREEAYKRIVPLLLHEGRAPEAAAVEAALAALPALDPAKNPAEESIRDSSAARAARIVQISALCLLGLGIATAMWLLFVAALRWRPDLSRAVNRLASALNYAPPLLLLAGLALYLGYYPYARPIGEFSSSESFIHSHAPFFWNVYAFGSMGPIVDVWLAHMFWPSIWCAAIALAGALLLRWTSRREHPDRTGAA